jgi:hypothetical protein
MDRSRNHEPGLQDTVFAEVSQPNLLRDLAARLLQDQQPVGSSNPISTLLQRFACARLSQPCLSESYPDFSATFTTIAFDDSSLRWLEINT